MKRIAATAVAVILAGGILAGCGGTNTVVKTKRVEVTPSACTELVTAARDAWSAEAAVADALADDNVSAEEFGPYLDRASAVWERVADAAMRCDAVAAGSGDLS